jgi:iron complex transport system substrate-binding protein
VSSSPARPRRRRAIATSAALAAAVAVVGLALGGCRPDEQRAPAGKTAAAPQRIVAIAPSAVELVFALGLGERVVGVGDYVAWPPEAAGLPRLGGLLDPQLETMAALRPDLAVLLPSERELGERLAALGIEVMVVPHETLADVEAAALAVSERAGVPAAGEAFAARWRRDLAADPLPGSPTVALIVARQAGELGRPLVAGPGTFLDELLARLGARNAFADAGLPWPQVGLEELVERDPDVLVELQPLAQSPAEAAALRRDWQRLPTLGAVRAGHLAVVGGDHTLIPGPRLPRLYGELREALRAASPPP